MILTERDDDESWVLRWANSTGEPNVREDTDYERCDVCDHLGMHCQFCDTDYDDGWPRGNCEDDPYVTGEDN